MIIFLEPTIKEYDVKGHFKLNYEWVEELSDHTSKEFNELSDIVKNLVRQLISDDVEYVKNIEVNFR